MWKQNRPRKRTVRKHNRRWRPRKELAIVAVDFVSRSPDEFRQHEAKTFAKHPVAGVSA